MLVYEFMAPADKVVTSAPSDTIESCIDKILNERISAVVVVDDTKAVGIVTKTDLTRAFQKGISLDKTVDSIMTSTNLLTIHKDLPHDAASSIFNKNHVHHAIVVDDNGKLAGVVTAWDCAREGYLNNKAWPWNRHALM